MTMHINERKTRVGVHPGQESKHGAHSASDPAPRADKDSRVAFPLTL
jgi:hypothetical protein